MSPVASRSIWGFVLLTFLAFTGLGAWSIGSPLYYLLNDVPPGQGVYILSKLTGLLAFSLFWLQAMAALLGGLPRLPGLASRLQPGHRVLGGTVLVLLVTHALLFFLAVSLRSGHPALGALTPDFSSGFYGFYRSLGVVALILACLAVLGGILRRHRPGLRWLHRAWAVTFLLVFLHGVSIGTETRLGAMVYLYWLMAGGLGLTLVLAVVRGWLPPSPGREELHVARG